MPDVIVSEDIDTFMCGGVLALPDVGMRVGTAATPAEITGSAGALMIAAKGTNKDITLRPSGTGAVKFPSVDGAVTAAIRVGFTHVSEEAWPASLVVGNGGTLITRGVAGGGSELNPIDPVDGMLTTPYEWNGTQNVVIGVDAGLALTTGNNNVLIGPNAGERMSNGTQTTIVGTLSGLQLTSEYHNTFVGCGAGWRFTGGNYNCMFGTDCGVYALGGEHVAFYGCASGMWNEGSNNSYFGANAGQQGTTAANNTAIGFAALNNNITGGFNTVVGTNALQHGGATQPPPPAVPTPLPLHENCAFGQSAAAGLMSGNYNVVIGRTAMVSELACSGSTVVGYQALYDINKNDIALGYNTVVGYKSGGGIVTGHNNTIIGANVYGLPADLTNHIIIADGGGNGRIVCNQYGQIGFGTLTPAASLHIMALSGASNIIRAETTADVQFYNALKKPNAEWIYGIGYAGATARDFFIFDSQNGKIGLHLSEGYVDNGHNLLLGAFDNRAARVQATAQTIHQIAAYYDANNWMGLYVDAAGIATFNGSSGTGTTSAIQFGHPTAVTNATEATAAGVASLKTFGGLYVEKKIIASGDVELVTGGTGYILKSPNLTRYRITVANGGALSAVAV